MNLIRTYKETIEEINSLQNQSIEFLFAINYQKTKGFCIPLNLIDQDQIQFSMNENNHNHIHSSFQLLPNNIAFSDYLESYNYVHNEILLGNSYLCNLTCKTEINCSLSLKEIYQYSQAKYKLYLKDLFVVFSPERFIRIENNKISTNPMKGTIDANRLDAEHLLKSSFKEQCEHATIIDLLRNDLSIVADHVHVNKYQYIEKLRTHRGELLQMSSEITGTVKTEYQNQFGNLIDKITPAGSISGAPKRKTLEIISQAESHERDFYTGIFGTYQNGVLDCGVMIRFIEQINDKLYFKSGGGIHALSDPLAEYEEMKNKIYVPIF